MRVGAEEALVEERLRVWGHHRANVQHVRLRKLLAHFVEQPARNRVVKSFASRSSGKRAGSSLRRATAITMTCRCQATNRRCQHCDLSDSHRSAQTMGEQSVLWCAPMR